MCYGNDRPPTRDDLFEAPPPQENEDRVMAVENLRDRLAETEARLERARAREAELSCCLDEMKKFVRVMEILESYLRRQYAEQQDRLARLYSSSSSSSSLLVPSK
ncbi:protein SKIP34-like [Salvia splendens]|uniref:protein SKIP34-like n=1 Tax=Salvia splendens TaxID=180675 RepID=UPI001103FFAD|nr:protein SKIP34-like [Salvia splendens]